MLSYTERRTLYGNLTGSQESVNLNWGDVMMNHYARTLCAGNGGSWWFLEEEVTQDTVADQEAYVLPASTRKIIDLRVDVGETPYTPLEIESAELWNRVQQMELGTDDRTEFYYRRGNKVLLAPIPGSSGNEILIQIRKNVVDLTEADVTAGTIDVTNGDETVSGSGTSFTDAMVGRKLRVEDGDKLWYEIASVTNGTELELLQPYEGNTDTGLDYTIGEVGIIPEAYQMIPVFQAASTYYTKEEKAGVADRFKQDADDLFNAMKEEAGEKTEGAYLPPIDNLVWRDPNIPQPKAPTNAF